MKATGNGLFWVLKYKPLVYGAIIFIGFVIGNQLSYLFYVVPAVFPLQSGVGLAGLVLWGLHLWPAIFLAALLINLFNGSSFFLAMTFATANALQALIGGYILKRAGFNPLLKRRKDIFSLMAVAIIASAIVPMVGSVAYSLLELITGNAPPIPWQAWWVGHVLSLLIVSPFLIRWTAGSYRRGNAKEGIEIGLAFGSLIVVNYLLFIADIGAINNIPLLYLLLLPLFWITLRMSPRWTTLALVVTSALALSGTALGSALPANMTLGELLFLTQIFLEAIAVIFFILMAVTEERRHAGRALEMHIQKLENALTKIRSEDQAKNEFVATLAHELRNPLAPLLTSIEVLKIKGPTAPEFPQLLQIMHERVDAMSRLLDDLLDIARITQQKFQLDRKIVSVQSIVDRLITGIEALMQKHGHHFILEMGREPDLMINADPVRIEQILMNLLNNAAKYTPNGGTVTLSVRRSGEDVILKVTDNGIGISPLMLTKIFEPFRQVHKRHMGGGMGIGLSLTKRLVELQGGDVTAHSEGEAQGSEFTVRLPLITTAIPSETEPIPFPPVNVSPVSTPKRIMVVDDNRPAAEGLAKLLELKGFHCRVAYDAAGAIAIAREFTPEVIILDIGLPDMSGYELAPKLKQEHSPNALLIAITGYGQESDKQKAKNSGFDHHLVKPVGIAEVEAVLATH